MNLHASLTPAIPHQLDSTYLRGQSQGRSQCVPHKDAQPAARRLRRHFLAGPKGRKAGKGKYQTILALWGFISCSNCCSQSCFTPASPCGISRRHGGSPATDWQLTLGTGRSPRGCQWQDQGTGWCAVWYAPSVLGYCRNTQIILCPDLKTAKLKSDLPVPIERFWWFLES